MTDTDPGQLRAFEQRVDANMGSKWSIPAFLAGWLAFYTGREAGLCRFQLRLAFRNLNGNSWCQVGWGAVGGVTHPSFPCSWQTFPILFSSFSVPFPILSERHTHTHTRRDGCLYRLVLELCVVIESRSRVPVKILVFSLEVYELQAAFSHMHCVSPICILIFGKLFFE